MKQSKRHKICNKSAHVHVENKCRRVQYTGAGMQPVSKKLRVDTENRHKKWQQIRRIKMQKKKGSVSKRKESTAKTIAAIMTTPATCARVYNKNKNS